MAPVTAFRCPQCNAALTPPGADADTITCAYCGTTSRVQRRSRVFEIPIRTAPPPQHRNLPVARQSHSAGFKIGSLITVLAVAGMAVGIGFCIKKKFFDKIGWDGLSAPILYDVNGDGTLDAIGRTRYVRSGDRMHLAAIDGKNGSLLWESAKEGTYSDVYQNHIMLAGDTLLVGDQEGGLVGWSAKNGSKLWRTEMGERTEEGCAGPAGAALVRTKDKQWHRITLADGARAEAAAPEPCIRLADYSNLRPLGAGIEIADVFTRQFDSDDIPGMRIDRLIRRAPDGPWVAIGSRSPGTATPMAALLKDRQPAWTTVIPEKPLEAKESDPDFVTLGKDVMIVVYEGRKTYDWRLASFAITNGLRKWDVKVPGGFMGVVSGVSTSDTHVFVSIWGRLEVFDLATGRHVWSVGE